MDAFGILLKFLISLCAGRFPFGDLPPVVPLLPWDALGQRQDASRRSSQSTGVSWPTLGSRKRRCCTARQPPFGSSSRQYDLTHNDDSEARCRRLRPFGLRVRLRPPTPSTEPSSVNSRPWRPSRPTIAQPVVGWTDG